MNEDSLANAWLRRSHALPAQAAFHAGRLLNLFWFHASQAWLLSSAGPTTLGSREFASSRDALLNLEACVLDTDATSIDRRCQAIGKLSSAWNEDFNWWSTGESGDFEDRQNNSGELTEPCFATQKVGCPPHDLSPKLRLPGRTWESWSG